MNREIIRANFATIKLNISYNLCNQPNGKLDVIDLLILDYIHKLPLYCRPMDNPTNDNPYYCTDGKFNYSEIWYPEFCEMYNCIDDAKFGENELYDRVDRLERLGLIRTFTDQPEVFIGYRTTGLYDEFVN